MDDKPEIVSLGSEPISQEEFQIRLERHQLQREFFNICSDNHQLFKTKNEQYGNAIVDTGVLGASVELVGVISRLKELVILNPTHGRDEYEAVENVARDIHNYANILMLMLLSENWEGKDLDPLEEVQKVLKRRQENET